MTQSLAQLPATVFAAAPDLVTTTGASGPGNAALVEAMPHVVEDVGEEDSQGDADEETTTVEPLAAEPAMDVLPPADPDDGAAGEPEGDGWWEGVTGKLAAVVDDGTSAATSLKNRGAAFFAYAADALLGPSDNPEDLAVLETVHGRVIVNKTTGKVVSGSTAAVAGLLAEHLNAHPEHFGMIMATLLTAASGVKVDYVEMLQDLLFSKYTKLATAIMGYLNPDDQEETEIGVRWLGSPEFGLAEESARVTAGLRNSAAKGLQLAVYLLFSVAKKFAASGLDVEVKGAGETEVVKAGAVAEGMFEVDGQAVSPTMTFPDILLGLAERRGWETVLTDPQAIDAQLFGEMIAGTALRKPAEDWKYKLTVGPRAEAGGKVAVRDEVTGIAAHMIGIADNDPAAQALAHDATTTPSLLGQFMVALKGALKAQLVIEDGQPTGLVIEGAISDAVRIFDRSILAQNVGVIADLQRALQQPGDNATGSVQIRLNVLKKGEVITLRDITFSVASEEAQVADGAGGSENGPKATFATAYSEIMDISSLMDVAARDAELIENGKPSLEISLGEVIDFSGIGSKSYAEEVTLTQLTDDKLERYRRMVPGYDWESLAGGVDSLGVVRLDARTVFSLSWTAVAAKLKSVAGDRKFKVRSYHGQLHNAVPDCLMLCLAYRMACLRDGPESAGAQNVVEQLLRGFWILPDEVEKIVEVAAQIKETGNLDVGGGAKATLGAIEIGGEVDAGLYTSSTTTVTPSPSAAGAPSSEGGTA